MSTEARNAEKPEDWFFDRSHEVINYEKEHYLVQRRKVNNLPPPDDETITGLCISGGGVRSATLGLGLLQVLSRAGLLKTIDYLCTVSGGGYIGSCLSSLLSAEPEYEDKEKSLKNENRRFDPTMTGLDAHNNPFVDLNNSYEYSTLNQARLKAKHQLHHLRRRGEYLTPSKGLMSWDVKRAVGALFGGTILHVILFLLLLSVAVSLHHLLLGLMSDGQFLPTLRHPSGILSEWQGQSIIDIDLIKPEAWQQMTFKERFATWLNGKLLPQFNLSVMAALQLPRVWLAFFIAGIVAGFVFVYWSRQLPKKMVDREAYERNVHTPADAAGCDRPGGEDVMQYVSARFIRIFNTFAYLTGPATAYLLAIILSQNGQMTHHAYFGMLWWPLAFALGLGVVTLIVVPLLLINFQERVSGRWYRSFYHGMQGASIYGLVLAGIFPVLIMLMFGEHGLFTKLLLSLIPVGLAYYLAMQGIGGKTRTNSTVNMLVKRLQMPLLNLSIYLFTGVALAAASRWVGYFERMLTGSGLNYAEASLILFGGSAFWLIVLGYLVNSNDLSLHYFYRDRLSETYLRTDGRVGRIEPETVPGKKAPEVYQGLSDINLRNHENLLLKDLGKDNNKGPYHLILATLNLQGSQDLAKKSIKSDHFIFSKFFIGSRTTGYVKTDSYKGGSTKLSTAMTISAAAVASGMGAISFAASNFYMTLFNLRTGYWIENPWYLFKQAKEKAYKTAGAVVRQSFSDKWPRLASRPFWLYYLFCEFTGNLSANAPRVYVSDGGHTGDNLGLLPLIQRKCKNIIVADFEEDGKLGFGSFNQAVRLSDVIYNTRIEIDLRPLVPEKTGENEHAYSRQSVVKGSVHYPDGTIGGIVYLKSSVSLSPDDTFEPAPIYVLNYYKNNPAFPHHSTADQYFDETQFEAYRLLGEHIGKQAVGIIRQPETEKG